MCLILLAGVDGVELPLARLVRRVDPGICDPACAYCAESDSHLASETLYSCSMLDVCEERPLRWRRDVEERDVQEDVVGARAYCCMCQSGQLHGHDVRQMLQRKSVRVEIEVDNSPTALEMSQNLGLAWRSHALEVNTSNSSPDHIL